MAEIISRVEDPDTKSCDVAVRLDCDSIKICESSGVTLEQIIKSYLDSLIDTQSRTVHRRLAKRSTEEDFEIPAGRVKDQILWAIDNKKF